MKNLQKIENVDRLERFYKYLNYEVSSSLLYAGSFFIAMLTPVLFFAAIVFTPFMLFVLYKEGKKGWIVFFIVILIFPMSLLAIFYPPLIMAGLIPFYLFCFFLKFEMKNWITEMRARNELVMRKIRKANEGAAMEDWTVMK